MVSCFVWITKVQSCADLFKVILIKILSLDITIIICLVNHLTLWGDFNANVRAVISTKDSNVSFTEAVTTSNFHIKLDEHISVLDYVKSISVIIDKALNFKSHVVTKYECEVGRWVIMEQ